MKLKFKKLEDERAKLEIQNDMMDKDYSALKKHSAELVQELNFLHASQSERIDELDMKFQLLKQDHQILKEENTDFKEQERVLKKEISLVEKSRDLFREELLEFKKGKPLILTT
jgi:chromosome segregation ATPase